MRVYELDSTSLSDVLFTYHEGRVYFGSERDDKRILYRFKKNKLYRVIYYNSKRHDNCLYTFTKYRIYRGDSTAPEDCLFTFYNGKIYNGFKLTDTNTLYTFKEGQIFRGSSDAEEDVLYTIDNHKLYRGAQTKKRLYAFQAKKGHWYHVFYTNNKQAVFTFTRRSSDAMPYPCSRMKQIRMLGLIDFLSLGLIDSPWSMIYFSLQMNDAVANCID